MFDGCWPERYAPIALYAQLLHFYMHNGLCLQDAMSNERNLRGRKAYKMQVTRLFYNTMHPLPE